MKARIVTTIIFLFSVRVAVAQLCQGSLGDPIVNITFGAGSNPGPVLSAATTGYTYNFDDCPSDGFYTVRNNTNACFGNSWHSLSVDHTGDPAGYFMLVNASIQPSFFYVDTVRGLCSNTNFEFAAWVVNVLKTSACSGNGIRPNLTFTIERTDGTVIHTYNTGFISSLPLPQWQQYGFFFTTPSDVSDVVLKIFNNSEGGCGNDLALDDITFRPCGPQITASVDGFTSSDDSIVVCKNAASSYTIRSSISAGFSNPAFQWQQSTDGVTWTDIAGANGAVYTVNFSAGAIGKFKYRIAAAEQVNFSSQRCRVTSPVITLVKGVPPVLNISITSPACIGNPITFSASGGNTYIWSSENGGISNSSPVFTIPTATVNLTGKIYVLASDAVGCTKLDSSVLLVQASPVAATVFTDTEICEGRSVQLNASGGVSYSWSPSGGLSKDDIANPLASPLSSTQYIVTVADINGCTDTSAVIVNVIKNIIADAGADKVIIKGDAVTLSNTTGPAVYQWSPSTYLSDPAVKAPVAKPQTDIDYILTATSLQGCNVDMDTVHITVYADLFVPSAFSPDGNGTNDTWNIPALNAFPAFELYLYNRNGNLVYQCKNVFVPWDGTYKGSPQDSGTYVYLIRLNNAGKRIIKGNLLLLR